MAPKIILLSLLLYLYYYYNSTRVHPLAPSRACLLKHITAVNYKNLQVKKTKLHSIELQLTRVE